MWNRVGKVDGPERRKQWLRFKKTTKTGEVGDRTALTQLVFQHLHSSNLAGIWF